MQSRRRQQVQRLTKDFQARAATFKRVAEQAADAERRVVLRARASVDSSHSEEGDEGEDAALLDLRSQGQMLEFNTEMIAEREEEIAEIASSMRDVNEMVGDLAVLVEEQGGEIDNIEFNVTEAESRTREGVGHLDEAERLQNKARNRTFCLLGIMFLIGAVVLVWQLMS